MRNTRYLFIDAQLYDYAHIERKLTRLAAEGWHLEKAGNLLWRFRRGEPKQVRYAVTFAPSASAFNSRPTEAEEDLTELCAQAGWVRVANQAQRHIYRNENPNATPLETDEAERLKNIRRTMKKHFFPTEAVMILLFLIQFFTQWINVSLSPTRTFSSYMMVSTMGMLLFVVLCHGLIALDGALWLRRARLAVEGGEPIPENRFYRRFRWVMWAILIVYLLCLLWTMGVGFLSWVIITSTVVLLAAVGGIALCKQLNAPRWVNMVVPTGLCALAIALLIPILVFTLDLSGGELPPAESLPLTLTQLTGETGTERLILEEHGTFLASYGRYWDTVEDEARLSYTIVDVKCPPIYDMILGEQEQQFMQSSLYSYLPIDGEQWSQFDAEYVRHSMNATGDRWLICWDTRIVNLRSSWELTEEQIDIIVEQLKP